jgi:hypothetical protein
MKTPQEPNQSKPQAWPFAFINGERTQASQELLDGKNYKTKDVLDTTEYEEALF